MYDPWSLNSFFFLIRDIRSVGICGISGGVQAGGGGGSSENKAGQDITKTTELTVKYNVSSGPKNL